MANAPELSRRVRRLIDAHFGGRTTPANEARMRQALDSNEAARRYYERHLILAGLDPRAPQLQQRLIPALGLPASRRSGAQALVFAAAGATAVVLVALVVTQHLGTEPDRVRDLRPRAYVARGPSVAERDLLVYQVRPGHKPTLVDKAIGPRAELAFAYRNPQRRKRLMIFGTDEHGHVYWYHPAWRKDHNNPVAVPISAQPGLHELPEAIRHHLRGNALEIHAVFTDVAMTVWQIEALVAKRPRPTGRLQIPHAQTHLLRLKVAN